MPDYAAGLSLGEYSALACAGVFDMQTAVALTAFRGKAMAAAAAGRTAQNGCLNAVILIQPAKLHSIGGVDHNDNILELFTNAVYHCNLAVT